MTILCAPECEALPVTASGLDLRALVPGDLPQMTALQTEVHRCLPQTHKSYIVIKTPEVFAGLLHHPHSAVGIFNLEDRLIAQAFLKVGHAGDLAGLADTPATRLLAGAYEKFGVPQGVLVSPDYRGLHLMRKMLHALEDHAKQTGLNTLVTEVAVGNDRSSNGFKDDAYSVVDTATDYDGTRLMFLQKTLRPFIPSPKSP